MAPNPESGARTRLIDQVVKLYVKMIKSDLEINHSEINTLYGLLESLFMDEEISWEDYVRKVLSTEINLEQTTQFLAHNLLTIDKVRILFSLIILAFADNSLKTSEVTRILDLAKTFGMDTVGFMNIIHQLEHGRDDGRALADFRWMNQVRRSLFRDWLMFGRAENADIRFGDRRLAEEEVLLTVVNDRIFLATGSQCTAGLNGKKLLPERLYLLSSEAVLELSNVYFKYEHLVKMHQTKFENDTINFRKSDYDFFFGKKQSHYNITLRRGTVYRNGRELTVGREAPVLFDDVIQIKGYDPFWLVDVIEHRDEFSVQNLLPDELFLTYENGYFSASRRQRAGSLLHLYSHQGVMYIEPPTKKGLEVKVNGEPLEKNRSLEANHDIISIDNRNFRINRLFDLVEVPFEAERLEAVNLRHTFADGTLAIDGISFSASRGQLVAVMGLSGCGKSSLLRAVSGQFIPKAGDVLIDGRSFYRNPTFFSRYIGYVPQDDLLFAELTVYENLYYRARLRLPQLTAEYLEQKIDNILMQVKLTHRRNQRVGNDDNPLLSGGERKRLNLALELLAEPAIIICDEPTSGLSSIDSEQVVEVLKDLTQQGKIVIITIHQPGPGIYEKFDAILVMDSGGRQVYFGKTEDAFAYFTEELTQITWYRENLLKKRRQKTPDYIFDMVEYPHYNENGEPVYEQTRGGMSIKRRFPPDYWRDKFRKRLLAELIQTDPNTGEARPRRPQVRLHDNLNLKSHLLMLKSAIMRSLLVKFRNRTNSYITFLEAPILGIIIAFILRLAPAADNYSWFANPNGGVFLFISVIAFIFMGMANSVEDILSERRIILREKALSAHTGFLIVSKLVSLTVSTVLQVALFYLPASLILGIKGVWLPNFVYFFAAGAVGFSLGLLVSCFVNNSRAIINILPLVLIPQIMLGGAIIQYEKMNHSLTVLRRSPIPEVVQLIPSRWLFEGSYTAQARLNPYDYHIDKLWDKRKRLDEDYTFGKITKEEYEASDYHGWHFNNTQKSVAARYPKEKYVNEDIRLVTQMMDGHFFNAQENVFLSSHKLVAGHDVSTYSYNLIMVLLYLLVFNAVSYVKLKLFYNE